MLINLLIENEHYGFNFFMLQYNICIFDLYTSSSANLFFPFLFFLFGGGGGGNPVSVMSFSFHVSILLRVYPMHSLSVYDTGLLLHKDVSFVIMIYAVWWTVHSSGKQTT